MSETNNHWLNSLPLGSRELVLAAMRAIDIDACNLHRRGQQLSPRGGEIAVGGEHVDHLAKAGGYFGFLRMLNRGTSPVDAAKHGVDEYREWLRSWNRSRPKDFQVHRHLADDPPWALTLQHRIRDALAGVELVDFGHAAGDCDCEICGRKYREHPMGGPPGWPDGRQFLNRLCDGRLVKL